MTRLTREEKLHLETWHSDRLTKDRLIGKTVVPFTDIIKYPIKKTKQSYVRIFDSFHSIDQLDSEGNVLGKLGELRVIVYLEDLGPVGLLVNRNEEVVEVVAADQEFQREADQVRIAGDQRVETGEFSKMPAEVALAEETIQQKAIIRELADIETKVIWELENWKRAEEARFRYNLKQKEADHIEKLRGEWRQKEIEREKVLAADIGLQRGRGQDGWT